MYSQLRYLKSRSTFAILCNTKQGSRWYHSCQHTRSCKGCTNHDCRLSLFCARTQKGTEHASSSTRSQTAHLTMQWQMWCPPEREHGSSHRQDTCAHLSTVCAPSPAMKGCQGQVAAERIHCSTACELVVICRTLFPNLEHRLSWTYEIPRGRRGKESRWLMRDNAACGSKVVKD